MDAAGSDRAAIFAVLDSGPTALLFAATAPERTSALILANTSARFVIDDDYPKGFPPEAAESVLHVLEDLWGSERAAEVMNPNRSGDQRFAQWYAK